MQLKSHFTIIAWWENFGKSERRTTCVSSFSRRTQKEGGVNRQKRHCPLLPYALSSCVTLLMDSFVSEVLELPCAKKFHLKRKKNFFWSSAQFNFISHIMTPFRLAILSVFVSQDFFKYLRIFNCVFTCKIFTNCLDWFKHINWHCKKVVFLGNI